MASSPSGYLIRAIREDFATNRELPAVPPLMPDSQPAHPKLTTAALQGYQAYRESTHLSAYKALSAAKRRTLYQGLATSIQNPVDQQMLAERGIEGDRQLRERFVNLLACRKIGESLAFATWAHNAGYQLIADPKAQYGQRIIGLQNS